MKVSDAIAEILRREGVETVIGYPVNHILERGAAAGIRPILVRQERTGLHMADAMSRVTSGDTMGGFVMQHGPGTENSYGAVAQAYGDSISVLVMPGGYARQKAWVDRNYNASVQMRGVTKSAEPILMPGELSSIMRRAFTRLRSGRGGPCLARKMGEGATKPGRTVFFVSHNMGAVARLCDRAVWLEQGRLRAMGDAEEIIADYLHTSANGSGELVFTGEASELPGSNIVRLRGVRICNQRGEVSS